MATERRQRIEDLPDTRRKGFFAGWTGNEDEESKKDKSWVYLVGCRRRQINYLKLELLPTVSACLLLSLQDVLECHSQNNKEEAADARLERPIDCITLLLANIVLLSKGNYDARLRSVVKQVCVEILCHELSSTAASATSDTNTKQQEEREEDPTKAIYYLQKAAASSTTDKKPKDHTAEALTNDSEIGRSVEHPKPSLLARATKRFERIECAIAEGMLHAMLEQDKNNQKKKHANDNASGGGGRAKSMCVLFPSHW